MAPIWPCLCIAWPWISKRKQE
jgi:hypothetical protein